MEGFGKRIREARQANGYTQSELASLLGCNVNTISRWEHDKFVPSSVEIAKLSDVLGVDITKTEDCKVDNSSSSLELNIEDIKLEIANAYRQKIKFKMIMIICLITITFLSILLFFVFSTNHLDPDTPNRPVTVIYYLEEGETIG